MRFTDWQLNRLRDSLRAYHCYERSHDGDSFTWKDVAEAIDEYTGLNIPAERLRQFVEGINTADGGRKFPVPKEDRLTAIYNFATTEEIGLLAESEMDEFMPSHQALLRLLEYLDQSFDGDRILPPETIEGVYHMQMAEPDEFSVSEITLERPMDSGLIEVRQTDDYYEPDIADQFGELSLQQKRHERNSRKRFGGWAILTPEDNLLFFLKNERNGRNRYYFTLASDLSHGSNVGLTQLFLLHHDYPLETEFSRKSPANIADDVIETTRRNLGIFTKLVWGRD